jgi:hypothetical protein
MSDWYTLNDRGFPVKSTMEDCAKWMKENEKQKAVAKTTIGGADISTVFLGLDHSWDGGKPLLWETMVFSNEINDQYQERYTSIRNAIIGHSKIVEAVLGGIEIE